MRMVTATVTLLLTSVASGLQAQAPAPTKPATSVAMLQSGPEVGRRAPDFTLPWASRDGIGPAESPYQLWGDLGKTIVLVFFPRAFTNTVTTEMQTFTTQYDSLFGSDVVVVGISTDSLEVQSRFAAQVGIPFRLVSDEGKRVSKKYGSYDSRGFSRSAVYVIGPDGKVAYRTRSFDPAQAKSYAELRAAVRAAKGSSPRAGE